MKKCTIFPYLLALLFLTLISTSALCEDDDFNSYAPEMEQESKERIQTLDNIGVMKRSPENGNGNKGNLVIVEPRNVVPVTKSGQFKIVPYRLRKKKWGTLAGVSYNLFRPENYQLDQLPVSYNEFYPSDPTGLINVEVVFKKNFKFFSMGLSSSIGHFRTNSDVEDVDSTLSVTPIKVGVYIGLNNFFSEPWVVPFFNGGGYTAFYSEKTGASNFSGNTLFAFHATMGLMIQMDWLDRSTSQVAYHDSGIENTFLYVAYNIMTDSVEDKDPRLGANFASAGLKIEF